MIESVGYDGRVPSYAAAMAELGDDNPVRNLLSKYEGRWLTPPGMGVWMTSAGDWDVGAYAGRGMDGKLRFLSSTTGRVKVGSLYTAVKEAENLGEKTVSKGYARVISMGSSPANQTVDLQSGLFSEGETPPTGCDWL